MYSIIRLLMRSFKRGKPAHQLIAGIIAIPLGALITWASLFADPNAIYPYFVLVGIVVIGFGIALLGKALFGFVALAARPKATPPVAGQVPYAGTPQYSQQPYAQPQYAQDPYAQPQYSQNPYAQPQYAQDPYAQSPYQQTQYPQQ